MNAVSVILLVEADVAFKHLFGARSSAYILDDILRIGK